MWNDTASEPKREREREEEKQIIERSSISLDCVFVCMCFCGRHQFETLSWHIIQIISKSNIFNWAPPLPSVATALLPLERCTSVWPTSPPSPPPPPSPSINGIRNEFPYAKFIAIFYSGNVVNRKLAIVDTLPVSLGALSHVRMALAR